MNQPTMNIVARILRRVAPKTVAKPPLVIGIRRGGLTRYDNHIDLLKED